MSQQIKNAYRYTLSDRLGNLIVQPIGEGDFSIEWEPDKEDGRRSYKKKFGGNILFTGEAYARLLKMETSIYRCEYQTVTIDRTCVEDGSRTWKPWFTGQISLNSGQWDLDGCKVQVEFEETKPEECFEINKNEKINLFQQIYTRRTVSLFAPNVSIEHNDCYIQHGSSTGDRDFYWCGTGDPYAQGWIPYRHIVTGDALDGTVTIATNWARMIMVQGCAAPAPSPEWTLIQESCTAQPFTRTYAKPVSLYDCQYGGPTEQDPSGSTMECKIYGESNAGTVIDNGLPLEEILRFFVQRFCPQVTIQSDFFQINPANPSAINYVTGKLSKVRYITVYQKSDVKRPNATGNATKMEWTFEKLMITIKYMFNVEWRIEAGKFLIEHVSYFLKGTGIDATQEQYSKFLNGKRKYSYKTDTIPKQEVWTWKEQAYYGDFPGVPVMYSNGCVTQGNKDSIKTYAIEDVMTDIEYALANPDANSSKVSDDGLFFIAAGLYQDVPGNITYYVLSEGGILEQERANNTLALAQLMRDYHRHERPLRYGSMNGQLTEFLSVIPTKKGETFAIPFCCGDEFNPDDIIKTPLGDGTVDKATFNFKTSMLQLELLYEANAGLVENTTPVATNETISTYAGEAVITDVLANDIDPDPDATVMSVEIISQPQHGVAEVMPDKKIKYTPEGPRNRYIKNSQVIEGYFMGKDGIVREGASYFVTDFMPVEEAETYFSMSGNQAPLNMRFVTAFNSSKSVMAPQGLENVSSVNFSISSGVRFVRVTVNIAHLNTYIFKGTKYYTGDDYYVYRYRDNWGQPSNNALVAVTVRPANAPPIARDDSYFVYLGNTLNVVAPGPLSNDSDDYGFSIDQYDSVTQQGGTVVMQPNGSFTYQPPAGFIGSDSFNYSIKDDRGLTDSATVTIAVRNMNYPIAQPDYYGTTINTQLVVGSGASNRLTSNDTTPAGGSPVYTTTAESKATAQGGAVTIGTDGSFTYTPATGFTGEDTFQYTVSNGSGSDTGTATVNVLPSIYVRMIQDDFKQSPVFIDCPGEPIPTDYGEKHTIDISFAFFSNSGGTAPLDVTGLGLELNIRESIRNAPGGTPYVYDYTSDTPNGTVWKMYNDYETYENTPGCGGTLYYSERDITLRPGNYTIIN